MSKIVSLDPRKEATPLPVANSHSPFQLSTQTGTVIIELTSTDGLFIFNPSWAEKVMGWYYPMDPATQTFGSPRRLDYNIDIDQFYETYRVISALFTVVGNTTSTTMAALSGNFNGVVSYNSLANLLGNNTSVYQIYSYSNLLGLTADNLAKEGAVPAFEGIGAFFVNNPRRPWARLEDSVPYSPSAGVDPTQSWYKFVDGNDTYCLHGRTQFKFPSPMTLDNTTPSYELSTGPILLDYMRASAINFAVAGILSSNSTTAILGAMLRYEIKDIAGSVINSGIMWESREGPFNPAFGNANWSRSGSFPTLFNTDEANMLPPARSITFYLRFFQVAGNQIITWVSSPGLNVELPVYNGLRDGLIQKPILIAHSGNEIGTKLSVSGRLNVEACMNSEVNKFIQVKYRVSSAAYERALLKLCGNPGKYDLKWVFNLRKLDEYMNQWDQQLTYKVISHTRDRVEHLNQQILQLLNQMPSDINAQASTWSKIKKTASKVGKHLVGVGKEAAEEMIRPIMEVAKREGKGQLQKILSEAIPLLASASTYVPPFVSYRSPVVSSAATGFFRAATDLPSKLVSDYRLTIPKNKVSLFPVLYIDENSDLQERDGTVAALFALVSSREVPSGPTTIRTKIKNNYIENYTQTVECPSITPIEPRENLTICKVESVQGANVVLTPPPFPITGRSLDLAVWAYNNNVAPGYVFSSQVDGGVIKAMSHDAASIKKKFVSDNKLTLVGNFFPYLDSDRIISAPTLTDLVKIFARLALDDPRKMIKGVGYAAIENIKLARKLSFAHLEIYEIAYNDGKITFRCTSPSSVIQQYLIEDDLYEIPLKFGDRYDVEKALSMTVENQVSYSCEVCQRQALSCLGVAATRIPRPKAQAALHITNLKDFDALIKLVKDSPDARPADLWRLLTLGSITPAVYSETAAGYIPGKPLLPEDFASKNNISTKVVPPQSTPVKMRARHIEKKKLNPTQIVASRAVHVAVEGDEREQSFPIDVRLYRQVLDDPSFIDSELDEETKALLYLTFVYFPNEGSRVYYDSNGQKFSNSRGWRISKRYISTFNALKQRIETNEAFSTAFKRLYSNLTKFQSNAVNATLAKLVQPRS